MGSPYIYIYIYIYDISRLRVNLSRDRDEKLTVVNTVLNTWFPENMENSVKAEEM